MSPAAYALHAFGNLHDVVAVGGEGDKTLAELQADVSCLATQLQVQSDVLVVCSDRYRLAVAILACLRRGCTAVLAHTQKTPALAELMETRNIAHCLHDGDADGLDLRVALRQSTASSGEAIAAVPAELRMVTLTTSGSTGTPVFFDKSAHQLLGEAWALAQLFGVGHTRCVMSTVPPRHIYGLLFGVLWPWQLGLAFVRDTPLLPSAILDTAQRFGADTLVAVPAHLGALAGAEGLEASEITRVFSSGAPLPNDCSTKLRQRYGWTTTEILGSTETGGFAFRRGTDPRFTPFPGMQLSLDATGTLCLRSPFLPSDAPLVTRDRVELFADGSFTHHGRSDDIVKVAGTRVSLATIERCARALPGVRDAAALSVDVGGVRGVEVSLLVVADGWDAAGLRQALSSSLDPLALPRRYRFVSELPYDAAGKLPKATLQALFSDSPPSAASTARRDFDVGPVTARATPSGTELLVNVHVPRNLAYFEGHFVGDPILPGVAQLQVLVVEQAHKAWPELGAPREVRRLKFTRPIRPDDSLQLSLVRGTESPRVDFHITASGESCASGTLVFAATRSAP